jgi:hypothetical protein
MPVFRGEVAPRLDISVNSHDNHLQAAFRALRHPLTEDADASIGVGRRLWYDLVQELPERDAAARRRRASGKTGERSNFEGDRSNLEGDRSNSERDRGKNARDGAV